MESVTSIFAVFPTIPAKTVDSRPYTIDRDLGVANRPDVGAAPCARPGGVPKTGIEVAGTNKRLHPPAPMTARAVEIERSGWLPLEATIGVALQFEPIMCLKISNLKTWRGHEAIMLLKIKWMKV
jgi:hypothetical protein